MSTSTIKLGPVSTYKGCYIVPVNEGFDVVDRLTGRWTHYANQRSARWNATVWTRLNGEFDAAEPLSVRRRAELEREAAKHANAAK